MDGLLILASGKVSLYSVENLSEIEKEIILKFSEEEGSSINYGKIRGNCGVVASDFVQFVENNYPDQRVVRVRGHFKLDSPISDKKDFYPKEVEEMGDKGLDFNKKEDRVSKYLFKSYTQIN